VEHKKNIFKNFEEFINENDTQYRVDECTIVGGSLENKMFLFKNRDRATALDQKVIRTKVSNVEVVYYTDEIGWVEGMNEHGVGFVFSALTAPKKLKNIEDKKRVYGKFKDSILTILTSKNVDEAIKKVHTTKKIGNFIVSDAKRMVEIEAFKDNGWTQKNGKVKYHMRDVDTSDIHIKSNHGVLIPEAGPDKPSRRAINHGDMTGRRAASEMRIHQTRMQLQGVKSVGDIPTRVKFQAYDPSSVLNTYRTDIEKTISQCLMNLTDLKFYFFYDSATTHQEVVELEDEFQEGVIKIEIRKS